MFSTSLVIVESPAKCKTLETYLGPGYKVIASFGHLRTITSLECIDINNNFTTNYSIIKEELKLKQIEKIRSEIAKADDVVIATDDDREGESIGWHICDLFGLDITNTKRIIFHEITETAVKKAILNPTRINMNIVNAQKSRQILDLLVGFTISPILWKCLSRKHDNSLSAGRCQTPALRLVYENYLDIKQSPGKLVHNIFGYFTNLNLLFELNIQFESEDKVTDFLEKCKDWEFIISTTPPKKTIKKSPEPLTTSGLQQLASNELHISPKETMRLAQQLYEAGYITYMRTDSKKYSQDFIESVKQYIKLTYNEQYISQTINSLVNTKETRDTKETNDNIFETEEYNKINKKRTNKNSKTNKINTNVNVQEAHESIRPVNINTISDKLDETILKNVKAIKLYELIWKRTLESCMPSAQYNSISAKISSPNNTEFVYKTEQPIFLGWQILEHNCVKKEDNNTKNYQYIQTLKQNVSIKPKKIETKTTIIELTSHYTEARLVQLLEEKGIGRPSTFASLVDKIQERKYVEKQNITGKTIECIDFSYIPGTDIVKHVSSREFGNEKNKLVIQPLGIIVIEFLLEKFDMFFNYEYTKIMEDTLDQIAEGKSVWYDLCNDCYTSLQKFTDNSDKLTKFSLIIDDNYSLIIGKHGPVVKYIDPKDIKNVSFIPVKKDVDLENLKTLDKIMLEDVIDNNIDLNKETIGKYKGQDLYIKKGKYGYYAQWGKETKTLKDFEGDKSNYIDIIRFLDMDNLLDPSKPVGLVREINKNISIRIGKYGDYIFYKKPRAKKAQFFKLNGFNGDYKKCDKALLLNWLKQTYEIE
jgi:DNA topoisomerase-1